MQVTTDNAEYVSKELNKSFNKPTVCIQVDSKI